MTPISIEDLRRHPELLDEIRAQAHQARARQVNALLSALAARIKWLLPRAEVQPCFGKAC
ncbi:MAG: hypothetical protein AB7O31_03295 [Burkholderiales bacterium]